jgi:hypothetical protein
MVGIKRPLSLVPLSFGFPQSLLRSFVLSSDLLPLGVNGGNPDQENHGEGGQGTKRQPLPPPTCSF